MTASSTLILPTRTHAVARDLRALLGAEKVKDDVPTITAYAVDASIYRIPPQAVVLVESEDDIAATVAYAVSRGIPLTPRAAGTNLTGSAIGSGIILDVSRLNRILEVNREETLGPGAARDRLGGIEQAAQLAGRCYSDRTLRAGTCASWAAWSPIIPPGLIHCAMAP